MLRLDWQEFAASGLDHTEFAGRGLAMTIGVFDGIHRGHQVLLERVLSSGLPAAVISFTRSPKFILRPETDEGDIMGAEQKLRLFEQMGIALAVMIDFSENFSKLNGKEFIDLLKDRGNLRFLTIGSNFRCGHRHTVDAAFIRRMNLESGIPTEVAEPVTVGGVQVSSSRIRSAIARGDIPGAAELLGRRVEIDFAGVSADRSAGGVCFDLASKNRIMPPVGRYPVLAFDNSPQGRETHISIERKGVFIPLNASGLNTVRRVEFLNGSQ
jgi:riboflavin kinase/FMN adenylyltransferase